MKEYDPMIALPDTGLPIMFKHRIGSAIVKNIGYCLYKINSIEFVTSSGSKVLIHNVISWSFIDVLSKDN